MRSLLDLIFPPACAGCSARTDRGICPACEDTIVRAWPSCGRCALPSASSPCRACRRDMPPFVAARAVTIYAGVARDALMTFKLGGARRAAPALAGLMLGPARELAPDVLTFVPATRRSMVARGFNPALELARSLGRAGGIPMIPLLRKVRETADQAGLDARARRRNQQGAYRARSVEPLRVALVDDIMTTGATARACSRTLLEAGAREVVVLVFARAP